MPLDVSLSQQLKSAAIPSGVTGWDALLAASLWDVSYANRGHCVLSYATFPAMSSGSIGDLYTVEPGFYAIVKEVQFVRIPGTTASARYYVGTNASQDNIADSGADAIAWAVDEAGIQVLTLFSQPSYLSAANAHAPVLVDGDSASNVIRWRYSGGGIHNCNVVLIGAIWPKGLK